MGVSRCFASDPHGGWTLMVVLFLCSQEAKGTVDWVDCKTRVQFSTRVSTRGFARPGEGGADRRAELRSRVFEGLRPSQPDEDFGMGVTWVATSEHGGGPLSPPASSRRARLGFLRSGLEWERGKCESYLAHF